MSDKGRLIYQEIELFYDIDPDASEIDISILTERILKKYPKHVDEFGIILDKLEYKPCANVVHELKSMALEVIGEQLAVALQTKSKDVNRLIDEYRKLQETADNTDTQTLNNVPITELVEKFRPENLIKVRPGILNDMLDGGIPNETHILVYARPECGKSLFTINMACGFMGQGLRVLYVENEEAGKVTMLRFMSRLSEMNRHQMIADPAKAEALARQAGSELLFIEPMAPGNFNELRRAADKIQPDVVVINQLSNFNSGNLSKVEKLERLSCDARTLSKEYACIVISVMQAADSAEGKRILDMGDIYFSNTGVQAQVDVMIGIGKDDALDTNNQRMLSLPRNKLSGNHGNVLVAIRPDISKVISLS